MHNESMIDEWLEFLGPSLKWGMEMSDMLCWFCSQWMIGLKLDVQYAIVIIEV